jgi:hypothetical protein
VVLDAKRVLSDQVPSERIDDALHRLGIRPTGGLPDARKAGVGPYPNDVSRADVEGFYRLDFH